MTSPVLYCTKLAQSLLCTMLENAKSSDPGQRHAAWRWLTDEDNYLLALILEATAPDIHMDWIHDYVRKCKEEFDEHPA